MYIFTYIYTVVYIYKYMFTHIHTSGFDAAGNRDHALTKAMSQNCP